MATIIIKPKNREEWLECRKSGIGSSEVATIVGLNPYETPYQLWRRKIGLDAPKEETFAMKAGHYLEDAVSQFWQDATGKKVIKSSVGDWIVKSKEKPFIQVSPDRTYWLDDQSRSTKNKGILECKTTQKTIDENDLPKHWFCQVQYQLGGAELEQGSIAWLTSGRSFGYCNLSFIPDFYGWLVEEVEKFWVDNVIGKQEPISQSAEDVLLKFSKHSDGKIVEANEDIMSAYCKLKGVKEEIAKLEEQEAILTDKIKLGFGDAEAMSYGGQTLATWKASKDSEKFDTKAFKMAYPDIAKEFTTITKGTRRFMLK